MTLLMIDIETLGLNPGAKVPTIGWARFTPTGVEDSGTINVDLDSHGNIEIDTVRFWLKQSPEAIERTFFRDEPGVAIGEALKSVKMLADSVDEVWANGPTFDLAHLETLKRRHAPNLGDLWSYRKPRDCRTLFETARIFTRWDRDAAQKLFSEQKWVVAHDAESDARIQAMLVIDAYDALMNVSRRAGVL